MEGTTEQTQAFATFPFGERGFQPFWGLGKNEEQQGDVEDDVTNTTLFAEIDGAGDHSYSVAFKVVSILILTFLMLVIMGLNSLVIFSFVGKHIPRTLSNFYMFQLAVADMCVGFVMPINILAIAVDSLSYSTMYCIMETAITICVLTASTACILALTIDRFQALTQALKYNSEMTKRRYFERSLVVWLFPVTICFILPMVWHNDLMDTPVKACYTLYIIKREYSMSFFLPMVFVIFLAVAVMYVPILKIALRHSRSINTVDIEVTPDVAVHNKHMKYQLRILKTATMVLLPFFGGWMPWIFTAACIVYNKEEYTNPGMLFRISQFISYPGVLNSGINPIIYAARMPEYRNAFRKLLHFRAPQPNLEDQNKNDARQRQK